MGKSVIVIGSGNAALCAGISALESGAEVVMIEKAPVHEAGGNSRYTAGAMRFVYESNDDLLPLLLNPEDPRIPQTDFGSYSKETFAQDLLGFNEGRPLSLHQYILINNSYDTMRWLGSHNVKFEPIYSRQSFQKDGKYIFWGGLTLASRGEGVGLVEDEMKEFLRLGGQVLYGMEARQLIHTANKVYGIKCLGTDGEVEILGDAVVLACGGFEASQRLREKYIGEHWGQSKVRGTPHNTGLGIEMALEAGAVFHGNPRGCHAVPMDLHMPNYGNLDIPYIERKHYRKICYFLGLMLNAEGERFVDEGLNFRNYTYAQFGRAILQQAGNFAWQVFDQKVEDLLYSEYRFWDASFVEANTLEELVEKMEGVNSSKALETIHAYNQAVDQKIAFDPTILDGKSTKGLPLNKSNWANLLDTPPFKAYPVTCGITFTYGGLHINEQAAVLKQDDTPIEGLFACGELVGGVFYNGYPGGSGLTSGAVFGRLAGHSATHEHHR
ncbi:MAG: FAD-dependent tricarballylate dehydrogenase TcuA [Bacteroidota bacterium]